MATFINRSHYTVSVDRRRDHKCEFPYDKESEARAYLESLRAQGLSAQISQGDDHWYVRIRRRGYSELSFDGGSYKDAKAAADRIEGSERPGSLSITWRPSDHPRRAFRALC
ncbi:MAG TPA: hypothetical protein VFX20_12485 [Steroidobacteraceae bacterium]|nr:hypothetical protein [Steroidobacteraceae bacterium]